MGEKTDDSDYKLYPSTIDQRNISHSLFYYSARKGGMGMGRGVDSGPSEVKFTYGTEDISILYATNLIAAMCTIISHSKYIRNGQDAE